MALCRHIIQTKETYWNEMYSRKILTKKRNRFIISFDMIQSGISNDLFLKLRLKSHTIKEVYFVMACRIE